MLKPSKITNAFTKVKSECHTKQQNGRHTSLDYTGNKLQQLATENESV
jgi:cell fate (sporulation/competence/biofilm development) regulator YlbF (YheA/YmcA/DUF963 family)